MPEYRWCLELEPSILFIYEYGSRIWQRLMAALISYRLEIGDDDGLMLAIRAEANLTIKRLT